MTLQESKRVLRSIVGNEHQRVEAALEALMDDFRRGAADTVELHFRQLKSHLDRTFALEASSLWLELARVERSEATCVAEEHARIRAQLNALGTTLDLQVVRVTSARILLGMLRRHARRADALLVHGAWSASPGPSLDEQAMP